MTTYTCKCGKTFQKNTESETTGYRMPDYGPDHECYGCPFVCDVMTWDPVIQENAVQNHECRASKSIQYDTQAALSLGDKCVGRVYSLDFEFLHQVRDFADSLKGIEPDQYAFSGRPADYGNDGRYKLTIYPAQNNKGTAAKQTLFEKFFHPDGSRKDVTPEQEKEIVLNQIKEAKAMAQGIQTEKPAGIRYIHKNLLYFAGRRHDSDKYTVLFNYREPEKYGEMPDVECATIPDFETLEEAQNALDGYASKRGFQPECSTNNKMPEMEQQTFDSLPDENEDSVPLADDTPEVEQGNDSPESGNDGTNSANGKDETSDFEDDTGDSANDTPDEPQDPCDWKIVSGDYDGRDDESGEDVENGEESPLPDGPDLSLRLPAFDSLFYTADDSLRDLARAMKTKLIESGELTIKVVINNYGGRLKPDPKKCKVDCAPKPAKVSTAIRFPDDLEIAVEQDGRVIIPEDRNQQLSFDETPSGTATVDGNSGIVEHYEEDVDNSEESQVEDIPSENSEDDSEDMDFEEAQNTQEDQLPYAGGNEIREGANEDE